MCTEYYFIFIIIVDSNFLLFICLLFCLFLYVVYNVYDIYNVTYKQAN